MVRHQQGHQESWVCFASLPQAPCVTLTQSLLLAVSVLQYSGDSSPALPLWVIGRCVPRRRANGGPTIRQLDAEPQWLCFMVRIIFHGWVHH